MEPVLLGDPAQVSAAADQVGAALTGVEIVDPARTMLFAEAAYNPSWSGWFLIGPSQSLEHNPFHKIGTTITISAIDGHAVNFGGLIELPPSAWNRGPDPWGVPEYWYRIDE